MAYDNFSALNERQTLLNNVEQQMQIRGLTDFDKKKRKYRESADALSNYLSSGKYTTADTQNYRSSATKAVEDLSEQLKTYSKSSNEYKTLDAYKNYYENSISAFDRIDVGTSAMDYASADSWHDSASYEAQRSALQNSIDSIQSEMDALDTESQDYKSLASYRDWYGELMKGLESRESFDRRFADADAYVTYQRSQDFNNTIQLQNNIAQAEAELKEIEDSGRARPLVYGDLSTADAGAMARSAQLQQQIAGWKEDLGKMESWQKEIALSNYYNAEDYDPNTNYEKLVSDLKDAKERAKDPVDKAKIDLQIRAIAGENYDGTNANGLFDDSTLLGQYIMSNFNVKDAQKRLDEINAELEAKGAPSQGWIGALSAFGDLARAGANAAMKTQTPAGTENYDRENDPEVMALRAEKTRLTQQMQSSERLQEREKMSAAFQALPKAQAEKLKAEGMKHMRADGDAYYNKSYDRSKAVVGDTSGVNPLKNFSAVLDDDTAPELRDMMYAAIGAEWTGEDIGYTVQDVLAAYEGQLAQIAGYKEAKKISEMNGDWARWNTQVLGVGALSGLNQFASGVQQFFTDDYIPANKIANLGGYTRADLARYGDEKILSGSSQGGSNLSQILFDTTQTTANMLPMIAASYIVSGGLGAAGVAAETAATAGKIAGAALMGVSSAGNSYNQALAEGWDKGDARVFSSIMGAAEAGMQYLIGGIGALGGVTEESVLAAAQGINNAAVRFVTETGVHILSETTEELAQNRLERYLSYNLFQKGDQDWWSWDDDDWYTVLVTALSTGAMEGPGAARNTFGAQKLGQQLSGAIIPSKGVTQRRQAQNALIAEIGSAMKGNEALSYTLIALGEQMDESSPAHELAVRMKEGRAPTNAMNLGNLFSAYMSENKDSDVTMASLIGGATKYHEIQKLTEAGNAAEAAYKQTVEANPEAQVLDKTATELKNRGVNDVSAALEYSAIVNKVLNGEELSGAEMTKLVSKNSAAQASRVLLSQRNESLSAEIDPVAAKEAISQIISDVREIRAQQKALTSTQVVQAAMDAAEKVNINRATANAELDPAKMASAAQELKTSQESADLAKAKLEAIEKMSFQEIAALDNSALGRLAGTTNVATVRHLTERMGALNERADALKKIKMPSKAQRTELANIRQEQTQIKQQIKALNQQATESVVAMAEEAAGKKNEAAVPAASGAPQAASSDYYVDPTGRVRTREEYVATRTAQGKSEAEANVEFERDAEMAGGIQHGQQATDHDGQGNDLGRRDDGAADRQRGDRHGQAVQRGRDGERSPIRPQSDGLGQRDETVDNSAVITDSKDVSSLGEEFSWLEDLTERLTGSGFQYINYITKGNLYNSAGQPVPALCIGGEMFLVVDQGSRGFIDAVARHEQLHMQMNLLRAQFGEAYSRLFVTGALQKLMTREQYIEAFRKYSRGDENNPGGYGKAYSKVDQETRIHMINEEILCDMVGGLETFEGFDMSEYQEAAWEYLGESNFDEVTEKLADPEFEGSPGELISADDLGVFPHSVPQDTLISDENVDSPSTEVASIQTVSRDAMYGLGKAFGFFVDSKTKTWYRSKEDAKAQRNGFKTFAEDQVEDSPLANLINWAVGRGISEESAKRQLQLFVGLGQIVDKTNDFYMAMQMFGSSLFTAMKLNSDNQYGTSEDVANICTKTQSVIDYMSEEMKRVKRGLTDDEILEIYRRIEAEGLPVNCPECYVFSRWIGIGGLLDNIYSYQNMYKDMAPEQVAAEYARLFGLVTAEVEKQKTDYITKALAEGKTQEEAQAEADKKFTRGKVRSKLVKEYETKYEKLTNKKADLEAQGKSLNEQEQADFDFYEANTTALRSLVWIKNVYFGGKVAFNDETGAAPANVNLASKVNPHFEVPSDVLFDLNAGEEFAYRYPEAWAFRTTQGAGYGKAIVPTAEAHLGESIMVTNNTGYLKTKQNAARKYQGDDELERHEASVAKNIFYTEKGPITPKSERGKVLGKTIKKELNQLFMGGQRLQSTSDSRYDTAIDTLLIAVELQAMRAGAQIYTKVLGAVPFYDAINGFVNMSMMPLVYGRMAGRLVSGGLDENGNPVDSPVGGVNPKLIEDYRKNYPHAGTITIGVNDQHIRAMFNQIIRDFIIPYHASGGKTEIVAEMRRIQDKALTQGRTDMPQSTDYTLTQTDKFLSDTALRKDMGYTEEQIEEAKRFREMRLWVLTGGKSGKQHMDLLQAESVEGLTRAQKNARKILAQLYKSIHDEGGRWHGVQLAKGKIDHQIFPNEFWDTSANYEGSSVNTQRYLDYCEALGVLHRFSGQGVKRGRVAAVNGYNAKGEQVALTDLAYQIDKDGNYVMTIDEDGNEVRAIEPFFWKTLVDRRMYDNDGNYMEQTPVTLNGLVGLSNENADEAVAAGVDLIANPKTGFAKPVEGERTYNRKKSLKLAEQPVARSALAMTAPGYQTTDEKAATDDLGQKLYVTPSNGGWVVERDTDGALLNTDYLIDDLGLKIYRNPIDEYVVEHRGVDAEGGKAHPTANFSTRPTYEQAYQYVKDQQAAGKMPENVRILDASSGRGHGAAMGKTIFGEDNVTDLEPFDPSRSKDYDKYGGLIAAIDAGEVEPFDFVISNAVINVMAQDAREQLMAALLRMVKPGGQIFINPADTGVGHRRTLTLGEYHAALESGEDLSDTNVLLVPESKSIGREQYIAPRGKDEMGSVQKAFKGAEFRAFAQDVAKQALGEDITVASGSNAPMKKGFLITRQGGETTSRYALAKGEEEALIIKNDTQRGVNFVEKLLDGTKNGETRDSKSITPNKWYGVSNGGKNSQVVGRIKFGEPIQISKDPNSEHYDLYVDAAIEGTDYDVKDGQTKWYYPVLKKEDFRSNPKPVLRTWPGHGAYQREEGKPVRPVIPPKVKKPAQTTEATQPEQTKAVAAQEAPSARYAMADAQHNDWAPEFYSKMQNTIEEWTNGKGQPLPPKMSAQQVVGWLRGKGVKAEEIKWSGIVPYLEGKKTVTRDELLGVMAENEIKIETKVLEDKLEGNTTFYQGLDPRDGNEYHFDTPDELMDYLDDLANEMGFDPKNLDYQMNPWSPDFLDIVDKTTGEQLTAIRMEEPEKTVNTKWSQYAEKGGFNYREILFKIPGLDYTNNAMQVHWSTTDEASDREDYGARNIIAHARIQDMYTADGKDVLYVEEIQSDLHNAGVSKVSPENTRGLTREHRAPGFAGKLQRELQEYNSILEDRDLTPEENRRYDQLMEQLAPESLKQAREAYQKAIANRARYKDDIDRIADEVTAVIKPMTELGLLRAKRTNIIDWIAGEDRHSGDFTYSDSSMLDVLTDKSTELRLSEETIAKIQEIRAAYQTVRDASEDLVVENRNLGMAPPDVPFAGSSDTYHEYAMKHLLRLAAEGDYDVIAWTTSELQSKRWSKKYEEGYKIEYDQAIPKFMNKYVKQWGSKVGSTTLDTGVEVWSVDITPEMKKSVLETGQPLFSLSRPAPDPERQLFDDLLSVAQSGDPEVIADWVTSQLDKNEQAKENARLRPPPVPSRSFVPKVTDSENAVLDAAIAELIGKHGQHRPSEKNATGFVIPKKNADGNKLSRVSQNVGSSEQMKAYVRQVKKFVLTEDAATYVATTNEDQIEHAKQVIHEDGFETALKNFNRYVNDPTVGFAKWGMELNQQIALGQQLLIEAGVNGNTRACLDVLTSLIMLGSQAGQSLQAMRLLKQSGPIGELYYAQKVVDKFNKQYQKLIEGKKMAQITIGQEYADAVVNAGTEEEREAALKDLKQHIADQLPVTFMDRWNAWRYLSMLGNLRTHIRNVIGNAVFVPLRVTKDLMAAGGEYLATKAGLMDEADRTKAVAVSRDYLDFAKQDAETMKQELQGSGKYNPAQEILNARKVLPGVLDKVNRVNSNGIGEGYGVLSKVLVGLEGEDWIFLRPAYARALGQALMHSGYTVEQLQGAGGPEAARALNNARRIAIEEAQRATYRDFSAAAAALNRLKQSGGIGGMLMEGILPFTKTPINILRRGIEYSPIGVATSVINFMKDVRDSGGAKNADMAKFIDRLSAGMTGTMVMILGALMARMGWLRGKKDDEKEENFDKLQGYQDYSLQIGDTSFTIDWAAPTALPLFVGAAANDILSGDDDIKWGDIWDVMMMVSEPMLSLSMLEGLNNVISSASYAKGGQKVMTITGSAVQSYLGQAFPTLLGQMARSIDGTRRTSYVDKNSSVPAGMQRFIQTSIQGKIPGWESQKTPYIDAWGREDTVSSKFLGALENFLSPSYINMVKSTDVDDEIKRLYGEVKDTAILPAVPAKYFSVNGETKNLTSDEYVSYAKDVGSTKYTLLSKMFYDPRYLALSDEEKAKAIGYIYTYASTAGKYHVDPSYDIHKQGVWIEEAEAMPNDIQRFDRIWAQIEKALKD